MQRLFTDAKLEKFELPKDQLAGFRGKGCVWFGHFVNYGGARRVGRNLLSCFHLPSWSLPDLPETSGRKELGGLLQACGSIVAISKIASLRTPTPIDRHVCC